MRYRVLDLFSGIGGFSLGLERTGGFETVAFCEIEPYCQRVLRKHWPEVPIFPDIRTLTSGDVQGIDLICGGFPCQDISIVGRGAGLVGKSSGLWQEFYRLICELRPKFIIVENVAEICVRGMGKVLGNLSDAGYDAEWEGIPACAIGGHHVRAREWILSYPSGIGNWIQENSILSRWKSFIDGSWWTSEPQVGRVAYGIPSRVDRLRGLGNAVVPQIPEIIGYAILGAEQKLQSSVK